VARASTDLMKKAYWAYDTVCPSIFCVLDGRETLMTKSDLIEHLCQVQKLPKGRAELLVNTIFDCLEQSLRRGERIEIRGFGSFEIRHYRAYQGRNPRTGSTVAVKPKRLPFFKVGKELKERVNNAVRKKSEGSAPTPASNGGPVGSAPNGHGSEGQAPDGSAAGASTPPRPRRPEA
jgi:integration host factor subunit beta